jgi:hypothetical protein
MQQPLHLIAMSLLIAATSFVARAENPAANAGQTDDEPNVRLFNWERGIGVRSRDDERMAMYLWVYEWNMFEAMKPGQHTGGTFPLPREVDDAGTTAKIESPELTLEMKAATGAVDLLLTVRNRTDRDWPEIAGIIPCFNPGPANSPDRSQAFVNTNTYFLGPEGLERLHKREIHFNQAVRKLVDAEADDGRYAWSDKWPKADPNAAAGLLIREATDAKWVTAIAWEEFLSAQGHNPWDCMHLCVRVGPLKAGESKSIRGRIYLFPGSKEDCLERIREDFDEKDK